MSALSFIAAVQGQDFFNHISHGSQNVIAECFPMLDRGHQQDALVAALLLFLAILVFIVAYLFQPIPVQ